MQDDNIGVLCLDFVELFSDVYSVLNINANLHCFKIMEYKFQLLLYYI